MKLSQVAVQLYTVRDFCQTAPELKETAKKIRAIGYTAVQLSGIGPIPETDSRHLAARV
jgi:sugar phosphate isomerase/epimerase